MHGGSPHVLSDCGTHTGFVARRSRHSIGHAQFQSQIQRGEKSGVLGRGASRHHFEQNGQSEPVSGHSATEEALRRFVHDSIMPVLAEGMMNIRFDARKEFRELSHRLCHDVRKEFLQVVDYLDTVDHKDHRSGSKDHAKDPRRGSKDPTKAHHSPSSPECRKGSKAKAGWAQVQNWHRASTAFNDLRATSRLISDEDSLHSISTTLLPQNARVDKSYPAVELDEGKFFSAIQKSPRMGMGRPRKKPATTFNPKADTISDSGSDEIVPEEPPPVLPLQVRGDDDQDASPVYRWKQVDELSEGGPEQAWKETRNNLTLAAQADKAAGSPVRVSSDDRSPRFSKYSSNATQITDLRHLPSPSGNKKLSWAIANSQRHHAADGKPWYRLSAKEILVSTNFDNCIGLMILVNATTIGVQTNYLATNETDISPQSFSVLEYVFLAVFACELALRIYVYKLLFFYDSPSLLWNWFDFVCVVAQLVEEVMLLVARNSEVHNGTLSNFRLTRVMRILRLMRILRVMRVLRLITELRTIVSSIAGSMRSLVWVLVLLLLMIYIVGVYFTQTVSEHIVDRNQQQGYTLSVPEETLKSYFGSLGRTILTLFQAISGGIDWDSLADPMVKEIGWFYGLAMSGYVAFAILALMNVVTGVFVQTALQSAKDEEDAFLTDQVIALFKATDKDKSMSLSWMEVDEALNDPIANPFFQSVDVTPDEAKNLFMLLDIDNSGEVQFDEFLNGFLRLRGPAKSIDLLTVMQEQRIVMLRQDQHCELVEQRLQATACVPDLQDRVLKLGYDVSDVLELLEEDQLTMRLMKKSMQDLAQNQREVTSGLRVIASLKHALESLGVESMNTESYANNEVGQFQATLV